MLYRGAYAPRISPEFGDLEGRVVMKKMLSVTLVLAFALVFGNAAFASPAVSIGLEPPTVSKTHVTICGAASSILPSRVSAWYNGKPVAVNFYIGSPKEMNLNGKWSVTLPKKEGVLRVLIVDENGKKDVARATIAQTGVTLLQ